jgi:hypothetical protein
MYFLVIFSLTSELPLALNALRYDASQFNNICHAIGSPMASGVKCGLHGGMNSKMKSWTVSW